MFLAFVIQNLWVCTIASLQECTARNVQHKLLHQCMRGWLCVSCLHNSESVGVHSSLAARMCSKKMCSTGCFSSICVGGCVFPTFIIQKLWVCRAASLEEMYSVGCCISICVWGYVFPTFVIQNLWVCTTASLEQKYSIGCCINCVWGYVFPTFVI